MGLMIVFGPKLSSPIGYWIQMEIQGPESAPSAIHHSLELPARELHGDSMSGKLQGLCQRDVLRFPFLPHIAL